VRSRLEREPLASIAEGAGVPEARVRQRVSRLTRRLRIAGVALVAVAGVALLVAALARRGRAPGTPEIERDYAGEQAARHQRAVELRDRAFADCEAQRWARCLDGLDQAVKLDPALEDDHRVPEWRQTATGGLEEDRLRREQQLDLERRQEAPHESEKPTP
jgi:hypothetical protein